MSKIKKYTKKFRKKLDKKNINVKETDVMELKKLRNKAKGMTDSRIKKKCTYKLWDIVCVVLIATLCNCDDWEEIYIFANENRKWLRSFLQLTGGIPTAETYENVTGTVSWTSSDEDVATVDTTGEEVVVTAVGEGEATITATCGDSTATCKVIVRKQTVEDIEKVDYYGKYINYDVDVDGDTTDNDWKIFYNDGTNIYIVTDEHIENTNGNIPVDELGFTRRTKYTLQWKSDFVKTGAIDIFGTNASSMTKYIANKYLSSWKNTMTESTWSENINAKIAAALMDTEAWSGFAASEKVRTLTSKQDELVAIGQI